MTLSILRSQLTSGLSVGCLCVLTGVATADVQALPGGTANAPIQLNRFGAAAVVEIKETIDIDDGDLLFCEESGRTLELRDTHVTSGVGPEPFRLLVIPTEEQFFVNLLEGELVSDSDAGVTVIVGDQLIGATGTRFLVSRRIEDGASVVKCLVFEGSVELRGSTNEAPRRIGHLDKWVSKRGEHVWGKVSDEELDLAAHRFARVALDTRPGVAATPEQKAELTDRYRLLFEKPDDPESQLGLVDFKLKNGVTFGVRQDVSALQRNPAVKRDASLRGRSRTAAGLWSMMNGRERDALAVVEPETLRDAIDHADLDERSAYGRAAAALRRSATWHRELQSARREVTVDPKKSIELCTTLAEKGANWPELHAVAARASLMLEKNDDAAASAVLALRTDADHNRLRPPEREAMWRLLGHVWLHDHVSPDGRAIAATRRFADAGLYRDAFRSMTGTQTDNVKWTIGEGLLARLTGDTRRSQRIAATVLRNRDLEGPSWVRPMVELLARGPR